MADPGPRTWQNLSWFAQHYSPRLPQHFIIAVLKGEVTALWAVSSRVVKEDDARG